VPPVIVNTALQIAVAITTESGLGFLGLSDPEIMSWGLMMGNARPYLLSAWWMMTFPGIFILVTVLSLHFVADGINHVLNPKRARY
jgi:peptide/nickel transport system permease protein